MLYAFALIGTIALSIWLALDGAAIYALPLVLIAAALARTIMRRARDGKNDSKNGSKIRPVDLERVDRNPQEL